MQDKRKRVRRADAGFTLVELMVVIAIIAVLATIVGVNVMGSLSEGDQVAAKAQIRSLKDAVVMYRTRYKQLPDSLDQLVNNPKDIQFIDANEVPLDPWGNAYQYEKESSSKFVITSYGADGMPGGSGYDADLSSDNLKDDS